MRRLLLSICLLLLPLPLLAAQVVLKERAYVSGESVLLGDVAEVKGDQELKELVLIRAPQTGITLSASFIRNRLTADVELSGADAVQVSRRMVEVSAGELEAIFKDAVMQYSPWKGRGRILVEEVNVPEKVLVPEADRYRLEAKFSERDDLLGPTTLKLRFGNSRSLHISGRIRVIAPVPVSKGVPAKAVIQPGNLELKPLDISEFPRVVMTPAECLGMRAKRALAAGMPINSSSVEMMPLVARGDTVIIMARVNNLIVSDRGVALRDGSKDQRIPVKNIRSGRQVFGTIIAPSRVEVEI